MKFYWKNSDVSKTKGRSGASAFHRIVKWSGRMLAFVRKEKTIYDFSEIETGPFGSVEIQRLVREAGRAAASKAKAVGIPKVFAKNNQILKQYSDGRIEVIAEAEGLEERMFFRSIKSEVLHARKK